MSRLQRIFETGGFAVTAEIGPPMSANRENVAEKAKELKPYADAANVTDNQTSIVRMSSLAGSVLALAEGVEPIMQMTCRDRNRIAIQSDLLGAWALGVRNILCLSGDHQSFGNDRGAKNVYDIDSVQLIKALADLRDEGKLMSGKVIKHPPQFFVGTTANPFADPFELQLIRLKKKIEAGARFVQTQAIYDIDIFEEWMKAVREMGLHRKAFIQAGVMVNKSSRSIEMTQKVPGMAIPDELVTRMKNASDVQEEGKKIVIEIIERIKKIEGIAGLHIMAVGWESVVPEIIERSGFLPRPRID